MRVVIVGLGVQGRKRRAVAGGDVVATVDPTVGEADYRRLSDVSEDRYDAALLCTPDGAKPALIEALLARHGQNQLRAARALGINRNTLRKRLDMLGIDP